MTDLTRRHAMASAASAAAVSLSGCLSGGDPGYTATILTDGANTPPGIDGVQVADVETDWFLSDEVVLEIEMDDGHGRGAFTFSTSVNGSPEQSQNVPMGVHSFTVPFRPAPERVYVRYSLNPYGVQDFIVEVSKDD